MMTYTTTDITDLPSSWSSIGNDTDGVTMAYDLQSNFTDVPIISSTWESSTRVRPSGSPNEPDVCSLWKVLKKIEL